MNPGRASHLLRRLRNHGIIRKAANRHACCLPRMGQRALANEPVGDVAVCCTIAHAIQPNDSISVDLDMGPMNPISRIVTERKNKS